jgi:hypothetical protein
MENLNLHKLKLYALVGAAIGLIAMLLPWQTYSFGMAGFGGMGGGSINGFHGWGWISLLGVIAVVIASLMGDKTKTYDDMSKNVALGGFAGIAAGAVIFMIRVMTVGGGGGFKTSPGFGLFICLLAGLAGLAVILGLVKIPDSKPPSPPTPPSPPPAPKP